MGEKELLKEKDILLVSYNAIEKNSEKLFDTTSEEKAKEAKIWHEDHSYKPIPIILGEHQLFPKIEEEIKKMSAGETKKIELQAKEAFGERSQELIKVLPLESFKKEKMMPFPGLLIQANGAVGKVQSVSGGRVRVDFNHELAGKTIEYEIKIEKQLKERKEIIQALIEKYYGFVPDEKGKNIIKEKETTLELAKELLESKEFQELNKQFTEILKKILPEEKIEFKELKTETEQKEKQETKKESE